MDDDIKITIQDVKDYLDRRYHEYAHTDFYTHEAHSEFLSDTLNHVHVMIKEVTDNV